MNQIVLGSHNLFLENNLEFTLDLLIYFGLKLINIFLTSNKNSIIFVFNQSFSRSRAILLVNNENTESSWALLGNFDDFSIFSKFFDTSRCSSDVFLKFFWIHFSVTLWDWFFSAFNFFSGSTSFSRNSSTISQGIEVFFQV